MLKRCIIVSTFFCLVHQYGTTAFAESEPEPKQLEAQSPSEDISGNTINGTSSVVKSEYCVTGELERNLRSLQAARLAEQSERASKAALDAIDRSIVSVNSEINRCRGLVAIQGAVNTLKGGLKLYAASDDEASDSSVSSQFVSNSFRLIVKFKAAFAPDLDNAGTLQLFGRAAISNSLQSIIDRHELRFSRAVDYSDEQLTSLHDPVRRHLPDEKGFNILEFSGLFEVESYAETNEELLDIAAELEQQPEVEYASVDAAEPAPPPVDYPPSSWNLASRQSYFGPNPGIDVNYARTLGLRGRGLTVADMEHSWGRLNHVGQDVHEDLHQQNISYGLPWRTNDFQDHGVAVMGILLAGDNGYGITGSIPEARGLVYSVIHGDTRILAAAIQDLGVGDIILMEMQRGDGGPPDIPKANWDLVKRGVDAGIVVVQTAGNGNQNMDAPRYAEYRARGDNGAIRVGAGTANRNHDKLGFSSYGRAIHIQGWGQQVLTLGYGNFREYGGDLNQRYTNTFNGTSSAGPIATSAVALVQSYARRRLGRSMTSRELRQLLIDTGIPQGRGGHIGPLPNIRAAIQAINRR